MACVIADTITGVVLTTLHRRRERPVSVGTAPGRDRPILDETSRVEWLTSSEDAVNVAPAPTN